MLPVKVLKVNKGQSVVETALILPIIILILTGIIDFGLMFNNYLIITNAAREAARSAALGYVDTSISTIIDNITSSLDSSKMRVSISPSDSSRKKGDEVTVTIEYDNSLLTPVISSVITNPVHLEAKAVMRVE